MWLGAWAMGTSLPSSARIGRAGETKKKMVEEGKFVNVFKKQADGRWKTVADIFNADAPAEVAK